jgi:hypothetical protein
MSVIFGITVQLHLHGRGNITGKADLSDVYTHRSQTNTTVTLVKRLYYIGGSIQTGARY